VYEYIKSRPLYYAPTDDEISLIEYVEGNSTVIQTEFTVRMEFTIEQLSKIDSYKNIADYRTKVSEILHSSVLRELREVLGGALGNKQKVCILIDNLDKAWRPRDDLKVLADFIFGLLSVSRAISDEFERNSTKWKKVNLSLIIFLRSDIFSYIMSEAREIDKLSFKRIDWNDPILLKRVIEERFLNSSSEIKYPEEVWDKFFVENIDGIATSEYIVRHIIPRPRDIIYFCKSALTAAVNHNHAKIQEDDIKQAESEYSEYAFNSLLAETSAQFPSFEKLLYEFAGSNAILIRSELEKFISDAGIPDNEFDHTIDELCNLTVLGLEIEPGKFEFMYNESRNKITRTLARKVSKSIALERFTINLSLRSFLGISSG